MSDRIEGEYVYATTNLFGEWMVWMRDEGVSVERLLRAPERIDRDEAEEWVRWWDQHAAHFVKKGSDRILDGIDALGEKHGHQLFLLEDEDGDHHAYKHLGEDGSGLLASQYQYDERGENLSGALIAALKTVEEPA